MPLTVPGRFARATSLAAALCVAALGSARAEPLRLADEGDLDRFAELVTAYKDTSRVRWVVEARDAADRSRIMSGLAERLGPARAPLIDRVISVGPIASTRSLASDDAENAGPTAHIAVAPAPERACSWRVTVADPAAPAPGGDRLTIPLERGDILPTSQQATIEVGFSGPLQSTLYAFAETAPGAVRDLAAAPDIAIPVDPRSTETLVLVRARRPVPFLDGIRTALGAKAGARAELGRNSALGERFRNGGRGIGANIQLVDPGMIVAQLEPKPGPAVTPPAQPDETPVARSDDLVETCLYTLTRLPG